MNYIHFDLSWQLHNTVPDTNMDNEKTQTAEGRVEDSRDLADLATREDHELTRWQCIKSNPWAFAWAAFGAWQILLVSYENQAAGLVVGIPKFREDFGYYQAGGWVLPPAWQGAHSGGPVAS